MNYRIVMNDELYHHGVLGMKWGVRRYQPYGEGGYTPKEKRQQKREAKRQAKVERKETKRLNKQVMKQRKKDAKIRRILTDAELKDRVERLEMEKKLNRLTKENLAPKRTKVNNLLNQVGDKTLPVILAGGTMYLGYGLLTRDWSAKKAAQYMFVNINKIKK